MIKIILLITIIFCLVSCDQSNTVEIDTSTWNKVDSIISENDFEEKYSFLKEGDTIWCNKIPVILIADNELYSHFLSKSQLSVKDVSFICKNAKDGRIYANDLLHFFTNESYEYKGGYEYAGMIGNDMYYYETKDSCKYYKITNSKELHDTNNPYNLPISSEEDR